MSGELSEQEIDLHVITDGDAAEASGVPDADVLVALAEAQVGDDDAALERARAGVVGKLGRDGLVDAAAVVANFERMVRIADSTGIPLDTPMNAMTGDIRGDLDLGRFASSANTAEAGWLAHALGGPARTALLSILKLGYSVRSRLIRR